MQSKKRGTRQSNDGAGGGDGTAAGRLSMNGLRQYAEAHQDAQVGSSICQTCSCYPDALEAIASFVKAKDAGDPAFVRMPVATSQASSPSLLSWLRQEFNYKLGQSAIRKHVQECVRGKQEERKE
jgi:hypothetical protein